MNTKLRRAIQLCTLGAASLMTTATFASNKELLQVLLSNGAINQDQYDALIKSAGDDGGAKITLDKGHLQFSNGDDSFSFQVGGRVQADAAWFSDEDGNDPSPGELGDGTELRRARLFIKGTVWNDWHFKGQYDFANDETSVKDAYIKYTGLQHVLGFPLDIQVGHFKEPFSLEELTSSKYITFMERALPNTFAPSRNIGIAFSSYGEVLNGGWSASAGWFGDTVEDDNDVGRDESYGYVGRVTFAPIAQKTVVTHLGGSFEYRKFKDNNITVRARPEAHLADERLVSIDLDEVDDVIRYNAEAAVVYGPFSAQAEYFYNDYDSQSSPDTGDYEGYYGYLSWFITGESRNYKVKEGVFSRVKPNSIVGKGGWGAWEVAARYSYLDLNDGSVTGGRESNWTFGLNWHPTPTVRFMANYIIADTEGGADVPIDPDVIQVRAQVDF